MADRSLTGVLLLGGASSRFGGQKALARIGDETLAARAWRVLGAACDERIAVGKREDGLELPFPLVDDGTEARAPVFGVIAGLRAAASDVCVFLPVDCVAMRPQALRALGEAVAVAQTGPLPGAYRRSALKLLEERVARGELSLKGVNPAVLRIDEAMLADVDTPDELERLAEQLHLAALDDDRLA